MTHRSDTLGRAVGMLTFLLGVGLLLLVFKIAYELFNLPASEALGMKFTGDPKTDPTLSRIGGQFGWVLIRIVYLFLMSIAGSLVSNKGINLYFSALQGHPVGETKAEKRKELPVKDPVDA